MSFQWHLVAGYLYFEVGLVLLLILPVASPRKWYRFFRSNAFTALQVRGSMYFYVILSILGLFLLDAIRDMRKYSHPTDATYTNVASELKGTVKLFRAQRNFYIVGFAIFLAFVLRRLIKMTIIQAEMLDKSEQIIQEVETAKQFAKESIRKHAVDTLGNEDRLAEIVKLKMQLELMKEELDAEKTKSSQLVKAIEEQDFKYNSRSQELKPRGDVEEIDR